MSKLTEIKQRFGATEALTKLGFEYTKEEKSVFDDIRYLLSLLEETYKALSFYADKNKYGDGNECHDPHAPINADVTDSTIILDGGNIARTALNTTKEEDQ